MSALIWIGRFYSDIIDSEYLFSGAILLDAPKYKTNLPIYILNDTHNRKTQATSIIDNEFIDFVCKTIKKLIRTNRYSFLCYSNKVAYRVCKKNPEFMDYFICLNNTNLQWLDFKGYTRLWLKRYVKTPPFKVCTKEGCKYAELHKHWSNYNSYIIQEDVSAGGKGSFILNNNNQQQIEQELNPYSYYIVSPFISHKLTCNNHVFIGKNDIIISPPSLQLFEQCGVRQLYNGALFKQLNNTDHIALMKHISKIAVKLRDVNYRGVCGIDTLIDQNSKVYFIEINCRFQGSSFILNKYLEREGKSIYMLNIKCFTNDDLLDYKRAINNLYIDCKMLNHLEKIYNNEYEVFDETSLQRVIYLNMSTFY